MSTPLMPKATAVWLIDNTTLSFDQVADFCGLHVLEVQGIADGDVAQGIKGRDPVQCLVDFAEHGVGQRVEAVGTVERDRRHAVASLE